MNTVVLVLWIYLEDQRYKMEILFGMMPVDEVFNNFAEDEVAKRCLHQRNYDVASWMVDNTLLEVNRIYNFHLVYLMITLVSFDGYLCNTRQHAG